MSNSTKAKRRQTLHLSRSLFDLRRQDVRQRIFLVLVDKRFERAVQRALLEHLRCVVLALAHQTAHHALDVDLLGAFVLAQRLENADFGALGGGVSGVEFAARLALAGARSAALLEEEQDVGRIRNAPDKLLAKAGGRNRAGGGKRKSKRQTKQQTHKINSNRKNERVRLAKRRK